MKDKKLIICRLIFEFFPHIGGSISHTIELCKHINPNCRKQFLIVPKADQDTNEFDKNFPFEIYRVNYFKFKWVHTLKARKHFRWLPIAPLVNLSYGLFALPLIYRLDQKYCIDIIHAHGISTGIIATITGKLLKKPIVWMLHGTNEAYFSGIYESLVARMFSPNHAIILDDGSPAPKKFSQLLKNKVTIVHHGIDSRIFRPKPPNKELLNRLRLRCNNFLILSAHSLIPVKGIEYTISGFGEFLRSSGSSDAILLVAGDGIIRKPLEEMANNLGITDKVLFLGEVDNSQMPDYLSISNIAVATSTYSNVNRSVQEAMACGKPVLAFDSGETRDLIQNMENGLLAETGNSKDFASKLLLLYKNPQLRTEIGEKARRFIEKRGSWNSRINIELEVYRKLLANKTKWSTKCTTKPIDEFLT